MSNQTVPSDNRSLAFLGWKTDQLKKQLDEYELETRKISRDVMNSRHRLTVIRTHFQNSECNADESPDMKNRIQSLISRLNAIQQKQTISKKDRQYQMKKNEELSRQLKKLNDRLSESQQTILFLSRHVHNLEKTKTDARCKELFNYLEKKKTYMLDQMFHTIKRYESKHLNIQQFIDEKKNYLAQIINDLHLTAENDHKEGGIREMFFNFWNNDEKKTKQIPYEDKMNEIMITLQKLQDQLTEYETFFDHLEKMSKDLEQSYKNEMNELKLLLRKMERNRQSDAPKKKKTHQENSDYKSSHISEQFQPSYYPETDQAEERLIFNPFKYTQ